MNTKKIFSFILCLCFAISVFSFAFHASASNGLPLVLDYADLLSDAEEAKLESKLSKMSSRLKFDIVALTSADLGGKSTGYYAADIYDGYDSGYVNRYGYGDDHDGILLFIDMENRSAYILGTGSGEFYADYECREYIFDKIWDDIADGDFYAAFDKFADTVEYLLKNVKPGSTDALKDHVVILGISLPFGADTLAKSALISLALGFIIALVIVLVMKNKMRSVRKSTNAGSYLKKESFQLTAQSDVFLYSTVSKVLRQTEEKSSGSSGSFRSSSGTSHTGGGRSF